MIDPVTEQCRRNREQLVERLGGLDGLFDRLEKLQRERDRAATRLAASRRRKAKPIARNERPNVVRWTSSQMPCAITIKTGACAGIPSQRSCPSERNAGGAELGAFRVEVAAEALEVPAEQHDVTTQTLFGK